MFQFQNYPLNDLWAGRKYIVDMWAKPLGLRAGVVSRGRSARKIGREKGTRGGTAGREERLPEMLSGDKWPPTDGRHFQIAPRCRSPASFCVSLRIFFECSLVAGGRLISEIPRDADVWHERTFVSPVIIWSLSKRRERPAFIPGFHSLTHACDPQFLFSLTIIHDAI